MSLNQSPPPEFHNFLDPIATAALESVAAALEQAFPTPAISDPVCLSDERLRWDMQWRAGQHSVATFLLDYLDARNNPPEQQAYSTLP